MIYEYDLNSAYPRALLEVPSLQGGQWIHWEKSVRQKIDHAPAPYALYHVKFEGNNPTIPGPIFVRAADGTISYPLHAENWIWSPEYEVLQEYCKLTGASYDTLEYWEYRPTSDIKPFAFIQPLYEKRRELKRLKDGAHVGIKLALNSLYGKLAQQVGWMRATAVYPLRIPTYHQLEWAGYVTSWCRANVLRAALHDLDAVIAFETDALFSARPLPLDIGSGLGQWSETRFRSLTYVQSGHYYGTKDDGERVEKFRGVDRGFISRRKVENKLKMAEHQRILNVKLTRFMGAGLALVRDFKIWRRWMTEPKALRLLPTGKRVHGNCWCASTGPLEIGKWHLTYCPVYGGVSAEYPVEWINPDPHMSELEELRSSENLYDVD